MPLDPISIIFVITILLIAVGLRQVRKTSFREIGSISVSLGMLGTFVGILQALMGFDSNNIEQSVPNLLDGMKLAFLTSVVGVGISVGLRVWEAIAVPPLPLGGPSPTAYLMLMQKQSEQLDTLIQQSKKIDRIAEHLGGVGDGSITTQLQKLRMDLKDFASEVSNSSTEAIIDALKAVVENFNQNLTTQFGENFKQLNEAVGRLLIWMENHKTIMEDSHRVMKIAVNSQKIASDALNKIHDKFSDIEETVKRVGDSIHGVDKNLGDVASKMVALTGQGEKMAEILSILILNNSRLADLIVHLSKIAESAPGKLTAVNSALERIKSSANEVDQVITRIEDQHRVMISTIQQSISTIQQSVQTFGQSVVNEIGKTEARHINMTIEVISQIDKIKTELASNVESIAERHNQITDEIKASIEDINKQNAAALQSQMRDYEAATEKALTQAMQKMGNGMATLSGKFVEDYVPLTDKLRDILRIAERVDSTRGNRV